MTTASFRKLHDAERARREKLGATAARVTGWCSCCGRGRQGSRGVAIVRLIGAPMSPAFRREAKRQGWTVMGSVGIGLCLRCAGLVAGAVGR